MKDSQMDEAVYVVSEGLVHEVECSRAWRTG